MRFLSAFFTSSARRFRASLQPRFHSSSGFKATPTRSAMTADVRLTAGKTSLATGQHPRKKTKKRKLNNRKTASNHSTSLSFRDPVGIQTQDLQNRNLTLYSAKLRDQKLLLRLQSYVFFVKCAREMTKNGCRRRGCRSAVWRSKRCLRLAEEAAGSSTGSHF